MVLKEAFSAAANMGFDPGDLTPPAYNGPPVVLAPPTNLCEAIVGGADKDHPEPQELPKEKIQIRQADGTTVLIDAEVARTPKEQAIGL